MARPGSRGGAPPLMRPPSASIRAANGGGGMMAPPTAGMRPPTSSLRRIGTMSGSNAMIAPINTNVSIEARPVTHQGLDGMRARTAGPARQIADKSYFISELRSKMTEIARETRSLGDEAAKLQRDAQLYAALERRYEERVAEVRVLEGQLADFNLAFDKVRTGAEIADVQHQQQRLRDANDLERRRLDEVFLQRADTEQRARAVEQEIEGVHRRAEQRMAALGDERRAEYARLQRENRQLLEDIHSKEQRIAQLDDRAFEAQGELKRDVYASVQRGLKLKRQHAQLEAEQQRLEEETSSALTPDEMRERLMAKVKEDTAFIEQAQARLEACDAQIAAHTDSLREKNEQLRDGAKGSEHAANYEKLVERDKKITDFLAQFPQDKAEALAMKDALQTSVVGLLQHISKGVAVQQTLGGGGAAAAAPTSAALGDMRDELLFKQGQMQNSEQTLGHLQRELEKRQGELDKINSLDSKISVELQTLNDKVKQMEADLVTFANVDGLAQMATEQKKNLLMEKQKCKSKRDALQTRVGQLHQKLERMKLDLQDSEVFKKLDALDQKARVLGQNIYTVADFVNSRQRESDYQTLQTQSMQMVQRINTLLIQSTV